MIQTNNIHLKEYLRPLEIYEVFGVDKTTLYRWMNEDDNFPKPLRPSKKITLINKRAFEEYLYKRSANNEN